MLSLLAFSAMHMNVVLAASNFGDAQIPIDHHAQSHESQQSDHFSCADEMHKTFSHRTDTEYHDNLLDCPIAQVFVPILEFSQTFVSLHTDKGFSRKPITLTHNITLQV
ncbi:hypothetical protein EBR66_00080 [bacterium]|nr:hypothetical protein [bacterium]